MKAKEGRDFLEFNECYAKTTREDTVILWAMDGGFELSSDEFNKLVKFVQKHTCKIKGEKND